MAYSYYQTAARLGFEIPNENENINVNVPKDYRYKKLDLSTTTGKNYNIKNNYLKELNTNYKNELSSEYNKNKYSREGQYHNYNNYTTHHFTDNVSEIFYSNTYDPSKDKNIINEIRPEKRKVYTNKYNQKILLNTSVDNSNKENININNANNIKYNNYFKSEDTIKKHPVNNDLNEDINDIESIPIYNEPENYPYNTSGSNIPNYNNSKNDGYQEKNEYYNTLNEKKIKDDQYNMKSNINEINRIRNVDSSKEKQNNYYNNIPIEKIDTKKLFYSTENSSYNHENDDKNKNNDNYIDYLIANKYKNNNTGLDSLINNKGTNNGKKVTFDTYSDGIENQLRNMNINEKKSEPSKTFQDIENEKRKLYNEFANNKKNSYDVNKWSKEYDKLNTLEKLNNYTSKRYNTSFDFENENININDNSKCISYDNQINNNNYNTLNNNDQKNFNINNEIKNNNNSLNTYNTNNNNISEINNTASPTPLKSNTEKAQSKDDNGVKPYIHSYIKNNPNPNLYDMRYYQRLNSSKRVHELLGGLNTELESKTSEYKYDNSNNSNNNNTLPRSNINDNITNMLKDLNKTNTENQQLKLEIQIQDRKIANLEKDLQQYKSDNLNLKKELEDKEKLCVSIMKEKKQKSENLEYLYSDCQSKLFNEKEENKNLRLYINNLEKELEISKKLLKNRYIANRSNVL